jgi:hypothetical protein
LPFSISQLWLVDSWMHAFAAALHGASVDCAGGGGFGVVVLGVVFVGVVVFGVVLVDDEDEDVGVVVLLDVAVDCVVGGVVVVVEVSTEEFWEPAARTGSGCGDPQALSTAVAAIAAPMISLRICISRLPQLCDPFASKDGPL